MTSERTETVGEHSGVGAGIRACARIGTVDIPYLRCGSGAPLLLIADDGVMRERLREALATRFKVFVPELRSRWHGLASAVWLRELIECLGVARPHVVVTGPRSVAVLHFAISDPDRIDRVVILWRERFASATPHSADDGAVEDRLQVAGRPLLMLRADGAKTDGARAAAAKGGAADADTEVRCTDLAAVARFLCAT